MNFGEYAMSYVGLSTKELWQQKIKEALKGSQILYNEPMSKHTTFKVGGPCDAMLIARNAQQIVEAIATCKENRIPFFVIGNGSNIIVRDGGIRGLVIKIGDSMSECLVKGKVITAKAGYKLSALARDAITRSLSGLEFIGGIPGTVGGAVTMNAGAYGGCISDCLTSVTYIDNDLNIKTIAPDDEDMGYRSTIFSRCNWIVVSAEFTLKRDTSGEARDRYEECNRLRKSKQPLWLPSAGSVFKRPQGNFAGYLIEQAGLKGTRVGGAEVSTMHAGFIVNAGGATASDIIALISHIQQNVYNRSGIALETEVKIVGEEI